MEYIQNILQNHLASTLRKKLVLLTGVIFMLGVMLIGVVIGVADMGLKAVVTALIHGTGRDHMIIWMLRIPRVLIATLVGFGLGTAGTIFQSILRNPLASSSTLGVASAAGFGAVCVIIFAPIGISNLWIAAGSFACATFSAGFILAVSKLKSANPETLILAGVAQMFLFSAMTSFCQYLGTEEQVVNIVFWSFGSLSKAGWLEIALAAGMIILPAPFLIRRAWDFNLLTQGDDTAKSLGIDVDHLRKISIVLVSLMTAGAICFTGAIGFIGLVAPHIARMLIGNDHQYLLPVSGVFGAVLVTASDIIARTILSPQVVPIGIVTALLGVPFFFYLLMRRARDNW